MTTNVPEKGQRTAEYIVDHEVPLTDLTEDELNLLVDYKAEIKKRDAAYQEQMEALKSAQEKIIAGHAQASANAAEVLDLLIAKAHNEGDGR